MNQQTKDGGPAFGTLEAGETGTQTHDVGLSTRELFAVVLFAGLLAHSGVGSDSFRSRADKAVQAADTLMERLSK